MLYRRTGSSGEWKAVKDISSGATLTYNNVIGMKTGNTYYYRIRAYKLSGGSRIYGTYSEIKSVKL